MPLLRLTTIQIELLIIPNLSQWEVFTIQMGKMSLPTCEICGGVMLWAWLEPEVGHGARLGTDGHAHHVLHLVDAVALRAAPGQLGKPLALPDQDEPLR